MYVLRFLLYNSSQGCFHLHILSYRNLQATVGFQYYKYVWGIKINASFHNGNLDPLDIL